MINHQKNVWNSCFFVFIFTLLCVFFFCCNDVFLFFLFVSTIYQHVFDNTTCIYTLLLLLFDFSEELNYIYCEDWEERGCVGGVTF